MKNVQLLHPVVVTGRTAPSKSYTSFEAGDVYRQNDFIRVWVDGVAVDIPMSNILAIVEVL